uniref:C2H2-type domain-containing protein n=1 Tax=Trichogramma kaykai TaxID=54128 RepID=A0ABD2WU11_9HYME
MQLFCDTLSVEVWRNCKRHLCCLKCAKRFSDWRCLRKHMNFFCQIDPLYQCPYCIYRARMNTLLKYHIAKFHPER